MERARTGYTREMARKILRECGITTPPVDLKIILAKKGYTYLEVNTFLDNIDAIFLNKDDQIYAAVNARHHIHRQRFSLAHELGHILLVHDIDYYKHNITLDNPPISKTHNTVETYFEKEANTFAGELLVPLDMLKKEFRKTNDINNLSKVFLVSKEVVSVAISNHMTSLFK